MIPRLLPPTSPTTACRCAYSGAPAVEADIDIDLPQIVCYLGFPRTCEINMVAYLDGFVVDHSAVLVHWFMWLQVAQPGYEEVEQVLLWRELVEDDLYCEIDSREKKGRRQSEDVATKRAQQVMRDVFPVRRRLAWILRPNLGHTSKIRITREQYGCCFLSVSGSWL